MSSIVSLKCPSCGGELKFSAEGQNYVCEWCGSVFSQAEAEALGAAAEREAEASSREEQQFAEDTDLYSCPSCGAEIICDHETAATFCYYCHNPVSLTGRLRGNYRPERVIPFKITREVAEGMFRLQCKKKLFLPSDFTSNSQVEKLTGLYVPFWLADCDTESSISGEAQIVHSVTHGDTTTTTTKYFLVGRSGKMNFRGVPADGSRKIDDDLMDAIEPFDYNGFVDFNMSYLSGFFADKYDVDKNEVLERINTRVKETAEDTLRSDISGYTSVNIRDRKFRMNKLGWHYMMLPVWFMTYRHGGQVYSYAINGQTGKVVGKYPVSKPKAAVMGLIIAAVVFALTIVIGGNI